MREKCPDTEFFLVRILSEYRKIRTRKSPYLDTFHAVKTSIFAKYKKKKKKKYWDTSTSSQVENLDAVDLKIS